MRLYKHEDQSDLDLFSTLFSTLLTLFVIVEYVQSILGFYSSMLLIETRKFLTLCRPNFKTNRRS